MVGSRVSSLFIFILMCCLAATPVRAQGVVVTVEEYESIAEVTGAVSIQGPSGVNAAPGLGVVLSTAIYANSIVGLVGELSSGHENLGSPYGASTTHSHRVRAALAGVRLRTPLIRAGRDNFRLFAQLVGGPQWTSDGPHGHVLQPGVGADDYLRYGLVVHVEYDYRFAPGNDRTVTMGRFMVGLGFPIGSR